MNPNNVHVRRFKVRFGCCNMGVMGRLGRSRWGRARGKEYHVPSALASTQINNRVLSFQQTVMAEHKFHDATDILNPAAGGTP